MSVESVEFEHEGRSYVIVFQRAKKSLYTFSLREVVGGIEYAYVIGDYRDGFGWSNVSTFPRTSCPPDLLRFALSKFNEKKFTVKYRGAPCCDDGKCEHCRRIVACALLVDRFREKFGIKPPEEKIRRGRR